MKVPAFGIVPALVALACKAADLSVEISGARDGGGLVNVTLYDAEADFLRKAFQVRRVPAVAGKAVTLFQDLAPGAYAISAYQDVNGNGKLDMSWLGYPNEPWGFSNDPRPARRPDFADARFDVGSIDMKIEFLLR
jgi:uncharacterized protein (DUF2141 family)